jgi:diguanylate cyclase (GGDEF)-like protein
VPYNITLEMRPQGTALALSAPGIANEGDWDDALPLRMDGYDAFGGYYPLDLNFNMYWDDNSVKLERFLRILNDSDYIVISSNRQWGSLPRLPERFPMTSLYYRELLGCPPEFAIDYCYRIANPGTFQGRLDEHLAYAQRYAKKLSVILCDIDHFKSVNDTYGHPAGDLVLKAVARTIAKEARATDLVARYGGEEFAVVMPETDAAGALVIAERIRERVGALALETDQGQLRVTLSLGVATFPEDAAKKGALVERADACLYQAKRGGRNRTVCAGAPKAPGRAAG